MESPRKGVILLIRQWLYKLAAPICCRIHCGKVATILYVCANFVEAVTSVAILMNIHCYASYSSKHCLIAMT